MESYNDILNSMVQKYEQLSKHSISEQSDIMIRLKVLAGEIYNSKTALEFVKKQMFPISATGEYLDKHAIERGLVRKEAKKASGEVTFSIQEEALSDIVINKGTIVATNDEDAKQFETTEEVTIIAGDLSVDANVTAMKSGADYNVLKDTVSVLVTPPLSVTAVTNKSAFLGGVDEENDDELRERILYSYRDISNGTNAVYYKKLAESINGVYSASVVSSIRGPGTVDVYICGKGSAEVTADHVEMVQKLLDENRELNVDILVSKATKLPTRWCFSLVVEDGYNFDEVALALKEKITNYINSLGVGEPALLCEIGDIIFHTAGVKNYEFLDAFCADIETSKAHYCAVGEIDIREEE